METFLSRYRNLTALLLLIVGQLLLLAYQVKGRDDVRMIRIWAVTAVTPMARAIEWVRSGTGGFFSGYVFLRNVQSENRQLREYSSQLRLKNQFLSAELSTADRAKALLEFRSRIPSRTLPARVIGTGTGANSRVLYVDRGSADGVKRGMAAITAEGIVGKVVASYPTASLVQLITEQESAAGVISQKNRVRGILKGHGKDTCVVEYIQNEEKLEPGEWFYTSGADRIYPRGLPVGQVKMVREGRGGKEVVVTPSALVGGGLEEMLIVLDGVHDLIPEIQAAPSTDISILPPPPVEDSTQPAPTAASEQTGPPQQTDADRVREKYKRIGESQNFAFGASPGRVADFNRPAPPVVPLPKVETAKPLTPPITPQPNTRTAKPLTSSITAPSNTRTGKPLTPSATPPPNSRIAKPLTPSATAPPNTRTGNPLSSSATAPPDARTTNPPAPSLTPPLNTSIAKPPAPAATAPPKGSTAKPPPPPNPSTSRPLTPSITPPPNARTATPLAPSKQ